MFVSTLSTDRPRILQSISSNLGFRWLIRDSSVVQIGVLAASVCVCVCVCVSVSWPFVVDLVRNAIFFVEWPGESQRVCHLPLPSSSRVVSAN